MKKLNKGSSKKKINANLSRLKKADAKSTPTTIDSESTQTKQNITSQQVAKARTSYNSAQTRLTDAQRKYETFMNRQTNTDGVDFLETGGIPSHQLQLEHKILWQNYQDAQTAAAAAEKAYDHLLEQYTSQLTNAEKTRYQQMDMGDLNNLKKSQQNIVHQTQTDAQAAQNNYGLYMNEMMHTSGDFLEGDFLSEDERAQQQALLNHAYTATDDWNHARESYHLMEDTYNYRYDMQIISEMSEVDKLALTLYSNGVNPISYISTLDPAQRQQLRDSGQYQQIITNPEAYLKQRGYGKENLNRLAESYSRYLNEQNMLEVQENAENFAQDHPFWSTVSTYPAEFAGKLTKGLSALGSGVEHTLGLSEYHTMDVNRPGYTLSAYSDAVRDTVSEDFNPTQRRAYNGVNTLVDEALEFAVGRGIAAATGAEDAAKIAMLIYDTVGAYGDASYDAALNGATTNESIASATATAGFHWLVNEINVDTLLNIKSRSDWDSVTNFIVDGVGNVSQVQLEYLGDLIIETAILAEDSSFNQQVESLVQTGMSREDAKKAVYAEHVREVELAIAREYASDLLLD